MELASLIIITAILLVLFFGLSNIRIELRYNNTLLEEQNEISKNIEFETKRGADAQEKYNNAYHIK